MGMHARRAVVRRRGRCSGLGPESLQARPPHGRARAQGARAEMVVDGRTLGRVLGTPGEGALAELAALCAGVVVCRASPAQKAAIVRMMARHKARRLQARPAPPAPAWPRPARLPVLTARLGTPLPSC